MQLPAHFQQVFSGEQIAEAVGRMGAEITVWCQEVWRHSHTDLLTIPVLRGGIFFFADLVRAIDASIEIAPTRTWAYEENSTKLETLKLHLADVPAAGRSVLIVDDICDSGRTLEELSAALMACGAREVKSAVAVRRALPALTYRPEWVGLEYQGAEWLVGYGMDDNNRYRNMSNICAILRHG